MKTTKVKIKATGEIIEVYPTTAVGGNRLYICNQYGLSYLPEELEPAKPDLQKVRIEFIGRAMQGILSGEHYNEVISTLISMGKFDDREQAVANLSILYADAAVAESQKGVEDADIQP